MNDASPTISALSKAARENGVWLVGGSMPERKADRLFNTCTVFNPKGELLGKFSKLHLFDICIPGKIEFRESLVLSAGERPFMFELEGWRIGLGICYDMRFNRLAQYYRDGGADLLIYPGAFNMVTGPLHWELLQRSLAVQQQLFVATCAPARGQDGYISYAHSMVSDPMGRILGQAGADEQVLIVDLHRPLIKETRESIPISKQARLF